MYIIILPLTTCTSYCLSEHAQHHTPFQNKHIITLSQNIHIILPFRTYTSHSLSEQAQYILPLGTCTFHSLSEHTHGISSQHINITLSPLSTSHSISALTHHIHTQHLHITLRLLSIQITSTPKLSTLTSHFRYHGTHTHTHTHDTPSHLSARTNGTPWGLTIQKPHSLSQPIHITSPQHIHTPVPHTSTKHIACTHG